MALFFDGHFNEFKKNLTMVRRRLVVLLLLLFPSCRRVGFIFFRKMSRPRPSCPDPVPDEVRALDQKRDADAQSLAPPPTSRGWNLADLKVALKTKINLLKEKKKRKKKEKKSKKKGTSSVCFLNTLSVVATPVRTAGPSWFPRARETKY